MIAQGMGGDIVYISSKNAVFAGPEQRRLRRREGRPGPPGAAARRRAGRARHPGQRHQPRRGGARLRDLRRRLGRQAGRGLRGARRRSSAPTTPSAPCSSSEVLPEHVADAVFALTGGRPVADHRAAHPGRRRRRRGVPAMTRAFAARRPRRVQRAGDARPGRARARWSCTRCTGSATARSRLPDGLYWDVLGLYTGRPRPGCGPPPGTTAAGRAGHRLLGRRLRAARRARRAAGQPACTTATRAPTP